MKSIKAKFRNKTKIISNIKDYQSLFQTVKARFEFTEPFRISYIDTDGDKIEITNQEDYENIDSPNPLIIYIETELEIQNISRIETSKNKSNQNIGDSVLMGIVNGNPLQQSNQVCLATEKPILETVFKQPPKASKQQQINNFIKPDLEQKMRKVIPPQSKVQQRKKTGRDCQICKEQITGPKWRCIDLTCFDFDVCSRCKNEGKIQQNHKKNHKFIELQDEKFISKINFIHVINKIFDSKYDKEKQIENIEEREWISYQDVFQNNPNFINSVWNSSTSLVDKIVGNFSKWQDYYQNSQVKIK